MTGPRQWAYTEIQDVPSEHDKTLFHCECDGALAQVAQVDHGAFILGDIQRLPGHSSGQLVVGSHA